MTAAMAMTASSWVRNSRASWPYGRALVALRVVGPGVADLRFPRAHHRSTLRGEEAGPCATSSWSSVTVDGRRIAYRRSGRGPTVLLLHGGVSDGREWLPLMTDVEADADVVALDVPGCGGSDDPPPRCTLADLADDVAGVVRALDLGPVHLGGLSFGGGLALQVAVRHPAVVRSLLLFSAYAGWAGSLPPEEVAARRAWARTFLTGSRPTDPAELVPGLLGSPLPSELADLLEQVSAGATAGPDDGPARGVRGRGPECRAGGRTVPDPGRARRARRAGAPSGGGGAAPRDPRVAAGGAPRCGPHGEPRGARPRPPSWCARSWRAISASCGLEPLSAKGSRTSSSRGCVQPRG